MFVVRVTFVGLAMASLRQRIKSTEEIKFTDKNGSHFTYLRE
jgi:hypothetical protein